MLKKSLLGALCALALIACQPMTAELSNDVNTNTIPKPGNLFPSKIQSNANKMDDDGNIENGLKLISSKMDELGFRHLKYQAIHQGVPIWSAETIIHINEAGDIYRVDGDIPTVNPELDTSPTVTAEVATTTALAALDGDGWTNIDANLFVFTGSERASLVWQIECLNAVNRQLLLIDAHTGKLLKTVDLSNT